MENNSKKDRYSYSNPSLSWPRSNSSLNTHFSVTQFSIPFSLFLTLFRVSIFVWFCWVSVCFDHEWMVDDISGFWWGTMIFVPIVLLKCLLLALEKWVCFSFAYGCVNWWKCMILFLFFFNLNFLSKWTLLKQIVNGLVSVLIKSEWIRNWIDKMISF